DGAGRGYPRPRGIATTAPPRRAIPRGRANFPMRSGDQSRRMPRVSDLDQAAVLDALDAVYQKVTAAAGGLGEADLMVPSRCAGWGGAGGVYHEMLGARRGVPPC